MSGRRLRASTLRRPWGDLRVWSAGSGDPLLAVHGLGGSGRYFGSLADALGDRFRVIAPDLAGFGGSGKPKGGERYDRAFHLANLDAAVGDDDRPAVVVGHSIGGVFAALWAARRPDRVRALALVATPYPTGDGGHAWMREGRLPPGLAVRAVRLAVPVLSLPIGVARGYPPAVAFDYGRQRPSARAKTMWWGLHDPGVGAELQMAAAALPSVPTLLLNAPDDRTVGLPAQAAWATLLPHAERRTAPTGGHQFLLRAGTAGLVAWLDATLRA